MYEKFIKTIRSIIILDFVFIFYLIISGFYLGRQASLVVLDPDLIKCILIKDFNYFTDRQNMNFRTSKYITEMLLNLKGSKWKGMRSQLTPAFTSGKLKTMEHLIDVCCNNMSEFLNENIKTGNYKVFLIDAQTFYKC